MPYFLPKQWKGKNFLELLTNNRASLCPVHIQYSGFPSIVCREKRQSDTRANAGTTCGSARVTHQNDCIKGTSEKFAPSNRPVVGRIAITRNGHGNRL